MNAPPESGDPRKRIQSGRNKVLALLLTAFVVLVYAISIAKMN